MSEPKRIQRQRTKGWRMPTDTVCVTRPTLWGNPFIHPDPAKAVDAYRQYCRGGTQSFEMGPGGLQFAGNAHRNTLHWAWSDWMRENIGSLRGKNLACFCSLDKPCHADVLLELANLPVCVPLPGAGLGLAKDGESVTPLPPATSPLP